MREKYLYGRMAFDENYIPCLHQESFRHRMVTQAAHVLRLCGLCGKTRRCGGCYCINDREHINNRDRSWKRYRRTQYR